jgi:hypothetical protein
LVPAFFRGQIIIGQKIPWNIPQKIHEEGHLAFTAPWASDWLLMPGRNVHFSAGDVCWFTAFGYHGVYTKIGI